MSSSRAATLHSGLLARKGHAVPAGGGYGAMAPAPPAAAVALPPPTAPEPAPRPKPVSLVGGGDSVMPLPTDAAAAAPGRPAASAPRPPREGDGARLRFTLRLDRQRYKQLRIVAAQTGRTRQEIVMQALEGYLRAAGPACACLRDGSETCDSG